MNYKRDREKVFAILRDIFNTLDKSGKNWELYLNKFKEMTDKEFIAFCKSPVLRLYIEAVDNEPKYDDILKLCDKYGCPLMEYITLPTLYKDPETGEELVSDKKAMVGPVLFKVLQQQASKEGVATSDIKNRDKFNQVSGADKAAMMSDQDVGALVAQGYHDTVKELLTFRADNDGGKEDAYSQIMSTGICNMPDSINDPKNKRALSMLDKYYRIAQIETNLINELEDR